ncbi:Na+/H+ antiporter NhaC family protein [Marinicella sp. W31]|uniref:Na+/H+ antiporter NhaC family protein n=1 Tax=Marinicella sp. W31 TaxID=3023713 RepID=UPI0037562D6D
MLQLSQRKLAYFGLIIITLLFINDTALAQEAAAEAEKNPFINSKWSVTPPLLAIAIALLFRQVIPALFIGIVFGAWILNGFTFSGLGVAILEAFQVYIVEALADKDHASVILFSLMIGGMVGITSRNGGTHGVVKMIVSWAHNVKRACIATVGMGLSIFFDDYANTLVVGKTMRPVTDKLHISRQKLAYLVDSTAAPVACIAFITTWVGFEVGLIDQAVKQIGSLDTNGYALFLQTIPYSFYPILALILVFTVAYTGRDFGPMYTAEVKARNAAVAATSNNEEPLEDDDIEPIEGKPQRAINAILPILALIVTVIGGLLYTGYDPENPKTLQQIIGDSDPYKGLLWGSLVGVLVAGVISMIQGILSLKQTVDAWYSGIKTMLLAIVILILAWALSAVTESLETSNYISSLVEDAIDVRWMPVIIFLLAALTAFATGTSWGAMGILIPLMVPLVWQMMTDQGLVNPEDMAILYLSISSILAGAVWGDHCSPISDTTILSSMSTQCDHVEHVKTQIPYAFYAGGFAVVAGIIPTSFGLSVWLSLLISAVLMVAGFRFLSKKV